MAMVMANGNGKASKGSKPDFLDLDKDGNKTEPMKSAAKSKKEETEYNYVNQYVEMNAPRMQKGAMAYDGPNKAASEAKDRVMAKTKAKRKGPKPTVTIDKPDKLVSMKVSKESFDAMIESGKFSDLELQRISSLMILKKDMDIKEILRRIQYTNHIKRNQEQKEWQIQIEESTLLHLRSSWQTEECNINNLTY